MSARPADPQPGTAVPLLVGGLAGVLLLPGLVAGVAAAEGLRARRLAWTWALAACPLAIALLVADGPGAAGRIHALAGAIDTGHVSAALVLRAGWLPWLVCAPVACLVWRLRRDRRDRLHGGQAERKVALARGPLQAAATRRAWREARTTGLLGERGILLGTDEHGAPVRVPRPRTHVTIVGASGSGKTTTARLLLAAQAQAGGGVVVLDGKGGRDLPRAALELAAAHGRPVFLWSPVAYGDPALDAVRVAWNPCSDGSPTEVKDRITSAEPQTEPYYAAIASRGLHAATAVLHARGEPVTLRRLSGLLDQPPELIALLQTTAAAADLAGEQAWLGGLTEGERSGLRGIATRLATMAVCEPGRWLHPVQGSRTLTLSDAIRENALVVFSLPQGTFPELVPHVGRYLLGALNAVAGRLETSGRQADVLVLVDELSAFDGDQLAAGLERGRSAGLRYVLATQSLSNFETSGGPKLAAAALDNAELVIVHRQAVPDAAELLAGLAGTEEAFEHTHKVSDGHGPLGWDEPGERARRLSNRYKAHPDTIKQLRTGEAVLIETRPEHRVRRVRVRPVPAPGPQPEPIRSPDA